MKAKTVKKTKAKARKAKAKTKATKTKTRKAKTKTKSTGKAKRAARAGAIRPTPALRRRALAFLDALRTQHPEVRCELDFETPLELLIATILAAQCTDKQVNLVTRRLFRKYTTAQSYVDAPTEELEEEIRSTGFFRNKTKSIKKACQSLVERTDGSVPDNMEELLRLGGVGRKTANVILANAFGVPGVVVDTHMLRIARRAGFTSNTDPTKVESDLMELLPEGEWISLSHLIPWHGRRVCSARKPMCDECGAAHECPKLL